jgi:hypothetical protein
MVHCNCPSCHAPVHLGSSYTRPTYTCQECGITVDVPEPNAGQQLLLSGLESTKASGSSAPPSKSKCPYCGSPISLTASYPYPTLTCKNCKGICRILDGAVLPPFVGTPSKPIRRKKTNQAFSKDSLKVAATGFSLVLIAVFLALPFVNGDRERYEKKVKREKADAMRSLGQQGTDEDLAKQLDDIKKFSEWYNREQEKRKKLLGE